MFKCEASKAMPFKIKDKMKTPTLLNCTRNQSQYTGKRLVSIAEEGTTASDMIK